MHNVSKRLFITVQGLLNWFRRPSVLTFLAGVILAKAFEYLFADVSEQYTGFLLSIISILTILVVLYFEKTLDLISHRLSASKNVGLVTYGEDKANEAFSKTAEIIRNAKSRIYVLSGYNPPPDTSVQPIMPQTRHAYLDAIENVVKERLSDKDTLHFT